MPTPPPSNIDPSPGTVQRLHHVGIAVNDVEASVERYHRLLGLERPPVMESAERGIRVAVVNAGGANFEFLQPMSPDSVFTEFLQKHGEGLHHICFVVESVTSSRDHLRSCAVELTNEDPIAGFNGHFIFSDPASTGGVRIELNELYPGKRDT